MSVDLKIQWLEGADRDIPLPSYETGQAAGADVRANFAPQMREAGITLAPGERVLVPTGFAMEIPVGFEVQVRPRSGWAFKHGVTVLNAPGTIDADYRGPVGVILINHGDEVFPIAHGDRIAQLVVAPVIQGAFTLSDDLSETQRGTGGFGSTGRR